MKFVMVLILAALIIVAAPTNKAFAAGESDYENFVSAVYEDGYFKLFSDAAAADILIDSNDFPSVIRAVDDLQDDIYKVTDARPAVKTRDSRLTSHVIIVGSVDKSKFIKQLADTGKIDVSGIKGKWESFLIKTVDNPLPGVEQALVIAGSDKRGTIFGIYELSEQIGVSPWYWWADVTPQKKDSLYVKPGSYVQGEPTVRYRGIFINDEYMLTQWSHKTHDPGKRIGPETYKRIFETLLRLKANFLWPAMNQVGESFYANPQNAKNANDYGIVVGSTHVDMLLRNNNHEWHAWAARNRKPDGSLPVYDYSVDPEYVYRYWEERVKEVKDYENAYSIGMRAIHDEPMPAANVQGVQGRIELLEKIFTDQREIIRKWVNEDVTEELQLFTPYKEVLDYYNAGLQVPDDVTIIWPNDNHGYIRNVPNDEERQRSGGHGLYYHQSYLGPPGQTYLWQATTPLSLMASELNKAIEYGIDKLWVLNVGSFKTREIPIDFMMRLAWDIDSWEASDVTGYLEDFAAKHFGEQYKEEIASVMIRYYQYNIARRPEFMEKGVYSLVNYGDEAQRVLNNFVAMLRDAEDVFKKLPEDLKDAYFQLILYPVRSSTLNLEQYIAADRSALYALQNRGKAVNMEAARSELALEMHERDINYYNFQMSNGKWRYFLDPYTDVNNHNLPHYAWLEKMPSVSHAAEISDKPVLGAIAEGQVSRYEDSELTFSVYSQDCRFIDLFNMGDGVVEWKASTSHEWIRLSKSEGTVEIQERIWVDIDWCSVPTGTSTGEIVLKSEGLTKAVAVKAFNPAYPARDEVEGHIESNGYVSIEAENFYNKVDTPQSQWQVFKGLGRSGDSVKVVPDLSESFTENIKDRAPVLQYKVYFFSTGEFPIEIHRVPTLAPMSGRFAISIDDGEPEVLVSTNNVNESQWRQNVLEQVEKIRSTITIETPGYHTLNVWKVDPGVIIDKIVINTGGLAYSYLGPPESYNSISKHSGQPTADLSAVTDLKWDVPEVVSPVFLVEAEDMSLSGYSIYENFAASQGRYVSVSGSGNVSAEYDGPAGIYNMKIDYFDDNFSKYTVYVNNEKVDEWESVLISRGVTTGDGASLERYNNVKAWIERSADLGYVPNTRTIKAVRLNPGDVITIEGSSNQEKGAKLDKLQIVELTEFGWGAFVEQNGEVYINADAAAENSKYASVVGKSSHTWAVRKGKYGLAMEVIPARGSHWTNTRVIRNFSPQMTFRIKFNTPGTYNVWLLVKANSSEKDSIHVGMDGIHRFTNENTLAKEFAWINVGRIANVSAGYHDLNFWAREDGIIIEQIYLGNTARPPKLVTEFVREK